MNDYSIKDIRTYLIQLGFKPSVKGFGYIVSAIDLCIKNPDNLNSITKTLYPDIARLHSTKASRVERAIRHAISLAKDDYNTMFEETFKPYSTSRLTNSLTLAVLLEHFI